MARRASNADRIAAALQGLEVAEKALVSIDEARLSTGGKQAVARLRAAITTSKAAAGDALEASLGGALIRSPEPPSPAPPLFSDGSGPS